MSNRIPRITLSDGYQIPLLGLGTWLSKHGQVEQAVKDAIDAGYRHVDTAVFYENESEVGQGIREKIADGTVKREDIFLTTKVWCTAHSRDKVLESCQRSLEKFNLDYIDLYLIHWPVGFQEGDDPLPTDKDGNFLYSDVDFMETWKGIEECWKRGWVRSIGVSNFNSEQIKRVCSEGTLRPVVNQVECHAYLSQRKLQQLCENLGIILTAYCPLGAPYKYDGTLPLLIEDPVVQEIASKHNKSSPQVLLRYLVQRGIIIIPKSVTKERIIANSQIFDFELEPSEMDKLYALDKGLRYVEFEWGLDHKEYPFSIPY